MNFLKQVAPSFSQYHSFHFEKIGEKVKMLIDSSQDDLLVILHRNNRLKQESIIKFEVGFSISNLIVYLI